MEREVINNNGRQLVDYLRKPYRGGVEVALKNKFPGNSEIIRRILDSLEMAGFAFVKRVQTRV